MVDLDWADSSRLYTPDWLDKFTDGSIIWLYEYRMNVAVMKQFCLMAAEQSVCDLDVTEMTLVNFADLVVCGGGPWQRSRHGTEPHLCRCSTLYPAMAATGGSGQFYVENHHQSNDSLYTDLMAWTPDVLIFKAWLAVACWNIPTS